MNPARMRTRGGAAIANGWAAFERILAAAGAPDAQRNDMRVAFYTGAATLFYGIMGMLDPGQEATPADEAKMEAIAREVEAFAEKADGELYAMLWALKNR